MTLTRWLLLLSFFSFFLVCDFWFLVIMFLLVELGEYFGFLFRYFCWFCFEIEVKECGLKLKRVRFREGR